MRLSYERGVSKREGKAFRRRPPGAKARGEVIVQDLWPTSRIGDSFLH